MIISAIAAMDRTGLIGNGMRMPWHLPGDLRRFRERTLGKPVIMGRRTFESLRAPLPGRLNIVLSHNPPSHAGGCRFARSIENALEIAEDYVGRVEGDEVMIIGGGVVFEATVPLWDRLLFTVVEGNFQGDTYFPLDRVKRTRWRIVDREFCGADARNAHPYWFLALERHEMAAPCSQDFDLGGWLTGQFDSTTGPDCSASEVARCSRQNGASVMRVEFEGGPADGMRKDVPDGVPMICLEDCESAGTEPDPFEGKSLGKSTYEITERKTEDGLVIFQYIETILDNPLESED
jgi:dihydrofolate reductase